MIKKVHNCLLILIIGVTLFSSCEKELDFKYHDVDSQLVIEGLLSDSGCDLRLTYTTSMDEAMNLTPITDADVTMTDLTTGESYIIHTDAEGIFRDHTIGIPGHDYRIEILREGKNYSADCRMHPAAEITGLQFRWIKMPYDHVAVLDIDFKDTEGVDDCYWIRIYRNDEPYKWLLSDDRSAIGGIISESTMTSRKDTDEADDKKVLYDGDVVKVEIVPVARNMYDYLTAIQNDSNGPRMFEGDFCLGYFIAASVSSSSIVYNPDSF